LLYQELTSETHKQHTLKRRIHCAGVGLHSGAKVRMALCPAEADTGIVFRRTDLPEGQNEIPARYDHVVDTRLCTVIANERGARIGTIEHVMAALAGCGIDNAVVEIDGPEVPIMDGSAEPFVFLIDCAGAAVQAAPRRALRVLRPVSVEEDGKTVSLLPGEGSVFAMEIEFDSAAIGRQRHEISLKPGAFKAQLSRARTFGFFEEIEMMRKAGLGRGGSLDNAVVVKGDSVLNPTGLRMKDEFVRHKALDAVGDIYLAGMPIIGRFEGFKAGHALNNKLLRALFADPRNYLLCDHAESEVQDASWTGEGWTEEDEKLAAAG
jgi:UDP-3-O-[3-hydroxymyristoyl] N-acetylglucosamine deacetylase